jgi:NADH-quinone oxidoreductase subunit M
MFDSIILSVLIWLPVLGAIIILTLSNSISDAVARYMALCISILSIILCVYLVYHFDSGTYSGLAHYKMQFVQDVPWITQLGIHYSLGVDGIALPLVVLTCFTTLVVILGSWSVVSEKVAQYLAAFLIMQAMVVGVFCARDAVLFYFFWEAMLIPMYLSIGIWGGKRRSYAAIKFFMFTFFGSALMLIALLYLYYKTGTFNIESWYLPKYHLSLLEQKYLFAAFFLAFAIKIPMWPLHTWLPDAHTEAPAGGSVILAALMLKLGGYGFLRFSLPITPNACQYFESGMIVLSLIAIVYVGLIALAQKDMKRLIAYSSVAHMGFVTLGCFIALLIWQVNHNQADSFMAMEGAMTQMISHAFGSGAMFLAFGVLYHQMHTRQIDNFGGIAKTMPVFAAFFMIYAMSNVGLPGTSGFVGEFMIILSSFQTSFWVTFLAASTLVVGAAYTLTMYKRVFYGPIVNDQVAKLRDVRGPDLLAFILLAAAVLCLGLYPNFLLNMMHSSVHQILELSVRSKF